jgi:hypothetical protein
MTSPFAHGYPNPFSQFLMEDPKLAYYGMPENRRYGSSPAAQRQFQSQFQNIYNEFLGQQGRMLMGGQMPQQNFSQFLDEYPFMERYSALPPAMRGARQSTFAPQASYRYF